MITKKDIIPNVECYFDLERFMTDCIKGLRLYKKKGVSFEVETLDNQTLSENNTFNQIVIRAYN